MIRVHLTGSRTFGAAALDAIRDAGHTITGITSPAHRPNSDATSPLAADPLHAAATRAGIPWADTITPDHVRGADVIVAAHSHAFIGRRTRSTVTHTIGYHPSLLPLHRGRDAIRWAIRDRDRITGGTVYHLTDRIDGGPLAAQDWCFIRPDDTPRTLWTRDLFPMGLRLITHALADLDAGRVVYVPQDETLATWEPSLNAAPLYRPELPELPASTGTAYTADRRYLRPHRRPVAGVTS